jgi:hypothetical protein
MNEARQAPNRSSPQMRRRQPGIRSNGRREGICTAGPAGDLGADEACHLSARVAARNTPTRAAEAAILGSALSCPHVNLLPTATTATTVVSRTHPSLAHSSPRTAPATKPLTTPRPRPLQRSDPLGGPPRAARVHDRRRDSLRARLELSHTSPPQVFWPPGAFEHTAALSPRTRQFSWHRIAVALGQVAKSPKLSSAAPVMLPAQVAS